MSNSNSDYSPTALDRVGIRRLCFYIQKQLMCLFGEFKHAEGFSKGFNGCFLWAVEQFGNDLKDRRGIKSYGWQYDGNVFKFIFTTDFQTIAIVLKQETLDVTSAWVEGVMFESHITVDMDREAFLRKCQEIQVKPVVIARDTGSDEVIQMMTAKFHHCKQQEQAMAEMEAIASCFPVVKRKKLEAIVGQKTEFPKHDYLEFHSKFLIQPEEIEKFQIKVEDLGGHSSQNELKYQTNNGVYLFATTRDREQMQNLILALPEYKLVNTIMECVVFDTNPTLDNHWCDCGIKQVDLHT